ncbi:MAG TPA: tetratricopeptide repeat protein [Acidobacteriaceae bacterium]|nr:tetratricopeptide repeat protein [Acidobacteriaceae bacterium]
MAKTLLCFVALWSAAMLQCLPAMSAGTQTPPGSEAELLRQGAQAIHEGRFADAELRFGDAVRAYPDSPNAYLGLGMTLLREGHGDKAEEPLEHAIRLRADLPGAHLFLSIAQYQQNQFDAAVDSLKTELQIQPNNTEVLSWLGIVEMARGDASAAVGPLDRAGALAPKDANILDLRARAHTQVARECFQQLYALDPKSWHVHRALAEIYSAGGQPERAAEEYAIAVKDQPNNADLYDALGVEYQRSGKLDEAAQAYGRALELNPHSTTALLQLGRIDVEGADPESGIPLLREAIDAHADPVQAYYLLGVGLGKTGHDQEAVGALETCLKQHPSPFIERAAWYALLPIYRRLNREADVRRAKAELDRLQAAGVAPR